MAAEPPFPEPKPKRAPTLYLIASIKIGKGTLLLLAGLGIFALAGQDLQNGFEQLVRWFGLDPERRLFAGIGGWLDKMTPANVRWAGLVTGLYSLISLVEGVGLVFRVSWAGWLAIGESAFFIPMEVRELIARPHWLVFSVLALNVWIVWYLFANRRRLFRHHRP
jgi:uncharacterized membrane protein (DUF2068 family)